MSQVIQTVVADTPEDVLTQLEELRAEAELMGMVEEGATDPEKFQQGYRAGICFHS